MILHMRLQISRTGRTEGAVGAFIGFFSYKENVDFEVMHRIYELTSYLYEFFYALPNVNYG